MASVRGGAVLRGWSAGFNLHQLRVSSHESRVLIDVLRIAIGI